jgi:hypothetical protein
LTKASRFPAGILSQNTAGVDAVFHAGCEQRLNGLLPRANRAG